MNHISDYILHLADTNLVLTQRNSAWCGHGPILEQDIAITNITLDLIGQSRLFYQYAAELISEQNGNSCDEDHLAYHRTEREFKNLLLVERPNGDWAHTIVRQFFYSQFQFLLYGKLKLSSDERLAGIAAKALKETTYHVQWCSEWVLRLGNGTVESHARMEAALDTLWPYTGEMFLPADYESALAQETVIPAVQDLKILWLENIKAVLEEATLELPAEGHAQQGGKSGLHTEELGFLLAEMQYLQRTYPNAEW